MADLDGLIRTRRHSVEEKQKILAKLYEESQRLNGEKDAYFKRIEAERKLMNDMNSIEAQRSYGLFLEATNKKIRDLNRDIEKVEKLINMAREDMRVAFAELKKVEIVAEARQKEEKKARRKKEDAEFDQIGIDRHYQSENK